ncbi:MAG: hypothetical protein OXQ29_01715 [Rhodospirillaceae bacterium]|nr:hypothetical protein [Rhodospirillaceae bacterium]
MPQSFTRFATFRLALPLVLILLTAACAPTTQYQNPGFVSMPAEWENRLAELDAKASNPELWPKNLDEAEEFIDELGQLIGRLSPLAEANYFPQLAGLRWKAIAFDALRREPAESGNSADGESPYSLAIQLRAIADENPDRLDSGLEQPDTSLMHMLLERANELENQDIKIRLSDASQYLENISSDPEVLSTNDAGIYELLDYLSYYESTRADWAQDISGVRENLEDTLAALEAETLDKTRRDYQAWALEQIWDFENAFEEIKSDEGLSFFDPIPDSWSWVEEEFTQIQNALISHLLPIDQTLLDLPVMKRYQTGFDIGWEVLERQDGRTAQTCVAIASAIVPKRTFFGSASAVPQSDRFDQNEQWEEMRCGH